MVWAGLIVPWGDAWLRVHPEDRGCVAQAWSVAEVLRCRLKTSE